MLPIILKDLIENLRTWALFAIASAFSTSLYTEQPQGHVILGFTQALVFTSGLVFAHSVVFAERKRRHLIFLKSLPISDSDIVSAKFIAVLTLTLSLASVPYMTGLVLGRPGSPSATIPSLSLVTLYTSLVLGLYICFRHPALPFLPLYASALLILWGEADLLHLLPVGTAQVAVISLIASVIIYQSTLCIFRRKELDF